MCDPLTAASLVATGVGSFIQQKQAADNAQAAVDAREEATRAEMARQDILQRRAAEQLDTTLGRFDAGAQQQAREQTQTERREALLPTAQAMQPLAAPISGSAPEVVRRAMESASADAAGRSRDKAQALADLGAWGSVGFGNQLALANAGRNIGTIGNFSTGSLNVLPAEQRVAAVNSQEFSPIGALLAGAGQLGSLAAFSRVPAAGQPTQLFPQTAAQPGQVFAPSQFPIRGGLF